MEDTGDANVGMRKNSPDWCVELVVHTMRLDFSLFCSKVFVGGIGELDQTALSAHFANYGTVMNVLVKYDHETGRPRGFAFVEFSSPEECQRVCLLFAYVLRMVLFPEGTRRAQSSH